MLPVRKLVLTLSLMSSISVAVAAPLPWGDKPYSHFSDQEPLVDMLTEVAASEKTPIVISSKIKGVVSGHFKERTAKAIFEEVANTQNLVWYFDKESLFVYTQDEVQTGSVSLKNLSPQEFSESLKRLQILDPKFKWEVSEVDNVINFNGPKRFIDIILETAKLMDNQKVTNRRIYKWIDNKKNVHYSTEKPFDVNGGKWDVKVDEKYPGFVVLQVVKD